MSGGCAWLCDCGGLRFFPPQGEVEVLGLGLWAGHLQP